nr:DUF2778 domain-containing protein [Mesorhizobium sp.]
MNTLRWVAVPCLGLAAIGFSATTIASLHAAGAISRSGGFEQASLVQQPEFKVERPASTGKTSMLAAVDYSRRQEHVSRTMLDPRDLDAAKTVQDPFANVVLEAKLSPAKLHAAFAAAGMEIAALEQGTSVEADPPAMASAERFLGVEQAYTFKQDDATSADPLSTLAVGHIGLNGELAYASTEAAPTEPLQLALASLDLDPADADIGIAIDDMSDNAEAPPAKPSAKPAKSTAKNAGKPKQDAEEPAAPKRKPRDSERDEPQQALAYARPDKPAAGAFKKLFNTPKAGNGVAIYDISAAVVHMPDGTKLEAHSGIGKMADNPKFVQVKMNGPTPPNTYKLSMREKRFHGVEAVRMTPIGKETMHGRDGILAHSYLLRGGRAESHGCVAFKDYDRFLKAFKKGKVTHIIVVPSLSKMPKVQLASNGRDT